MSLESFTLAYSQLLPGEQSQFAEVVRRLLADGIIWREDDQNRRIYNFLLRHKDLVEDYLSVTGWEVRHHERTNVFHVVHRDGSHRLKISRDNTIWFLLARLVYAEQCERLEVSLTRYPTITVANLSERYTDFLRGQSVRKKKSMDDALRLMQSLKLIRAGGGCILRASNGEAVIELLPTLEVVMPEGSIFQISEYLSEYNRSKSSDDDE
jgi:hypothetical protein